MVVAAKPGQLQPVYINGHNFEQASAFDPKSSEAETADRTISGKLLLDGPLLGDTYPTVNDKLVIRIAWESVSANDMDQFARLRARFGFFDVCLWDWVQEEFVSTGSADYKLKRRPATAFIASEFLPTNSVDYEPVMWEDDQPIGGAVTVGTEDSEGFTAIELADPPTAGVKFSIRYAPLYRMRRRDFKRSPFANMAERQEFEFEEQ